MNPKRNTMRASYDRDHGFFKPILCSNELNQISPSCADEISEKSRLRNENMNDHYELEKS